MPQRPKRPCAQPGCSELTDRRYCATHEHKALELARARDATRLSARQRGYDSRWDRYSIAFIARHPLCHYCKAIGRATATECVDHATPHRGDRRLFWDPSNHRPACISCNSRKGDRDEPTFLAALRGEGGRNR